MGSGGGPLSGGWGERETVQRSAGLRKESCLSRWHASPLQPLPQGPSGRHTQPGRVTLMGSLEPAPQGWHGRGGRPCPHPQEQPLTDRKPLSREKSWSSRYNPPTHAGLSSLGTSLGLSVLPPASLCPEKSPSEGHTRQPRPHLALG